MTSVNFNTAANSALRTLQSSNAQLDATQNRISTGLKIGEAKDNAAYWSISTTMKSDNKALSTVTDALGLGAATVDTAYQGLSAAKDVLDEIKSKLTAALGSNVDRTAIQAEIESLQQQLKSIASSSTFSGENWLSVNSSLTTYSADKTIVSSFTRDVSGSVTVGEIGIDTRGAVLFDANTNSAARGILDSNNALKVVVNGTETNLTFGGGEVAGNTSTGGISVKTGAAGTGAAPTFAEFELVGTYAANSLAVGDKIEFDVFLGSDAVGKKISLEITAANKATDDAFRTALQGKLDEVLGSGKLTAFDGGAGNDVVIRSAVQGADQSFKIGAVTKVDDAASSTLGLSAVAINSTPRITNGNAQIDLGDFDNTGAKVGDTLTWSMDIDSSGTPVDFELVLDANNIASAENLKAAMVGVMNATAPAGFGAGTVRAVNATSTDMVFELSVAYVTTTANTNDEIDLTTGFAVNRAATDLTAAGFVTAGSVTAMEGAGTRSQVVFDKFEAMTFDADDQLALTVNGGNVSITKAVVDAALSTTDGKIANVDDFAKVLNAAFTTANVAVVASKNADGDLVIDSRAAGAAAPAVTISAVTANSGSIATGSAAAISVAGIDITDAKLNSLGATDADKRVQAITAYINVVNSAINKVTAAATAIGSVAKRVELQQTFVQNLMDTIDKGVSGLVDADMNEESTKLQALQVKQQLGVQALSIANQSAQNVLRLFQ